MKGICFKCMVGTIHPFHDNGKANPRDINQFMGIDWFDEEREDKERIQRDVRH